MEKIWERFQIKQAQDSAPIEVTIDSGGNLKGEPLYIVQAAPVHPGPPIINAFDLSMTRTT